MLRVQRPKQPIHLMFSLIGLLLLISACIPESSSIWSLSGATPPAPPVSPILHAEIVFRVQIPLNTPEDSVIYIELLDEVTGLGLNPVRYQLAAETASYYSIRLPFLMGTVIKYRYLAGPTPLLIENTTKGSQVRYRLFPVTGPGMVQDIVATWSGKSFSGETGRIFGGITDRTSGMPIADALVNAAGVQAISAADGTFWLDGIPQGTHHLTVYSIDGQHMVFEQSALVVPGAATQANVQLTPTHFVNVSFVVNIPTPPVDNAQIRMIGNLYSLGNTYADLGGGINTLASRAPTLSKIDEESYGITLHLPAGFDLRYKYSLGDGFWNAEHLAGRFHVRQLIIPNEDIVVEDTVETWSSGDAAPIVFVARTPANTPATDEVYIQFNPYAWLEPLPMWQSSPHDWVFILSSPLELLGKVQYRYCRNGYCPQGDEEDPLSPGGIFDMSQEVQIFQDHIETWPYLSTGEDIAVVPSGEIGVREEPFVAGVEYSPAYHPNWRAQQVEGLKRVQALNGNFLVITPTWTITQQNPPIITPLPGRDSLWTDWVALANHVNEVGLPLAIYPQPSRNIDIAKWWIDAERDLSWWYSWYDRYQTFIVHHARLADHVGATALIIGGPEIAPAYPNGLLPDGSPSGTPDDAEGRWRELIDEVRKVFHGQLMFALPYDGSLIMPPPFLAEFDQLYLLWEVAIPDHDIGTYTDSAAFIYGKLERDIRPLSMNTGKPVVIAFQFCSSSLLACDPDQFGFETRPDTIDLQFQQDMYNAALTAVDSSYWVNGFVSRGYFPTVMLEDGSPSVNGKPAWNILWYWYPRLLEGYSNGH